MFVTFVLFKFSVFVSQSGAYTMELVYNWRILVLGVLAAAGTGAEGSLEKRDFDVFQYVDPFIGTINGGMKDCPKSEHL
jgi:hypothetical protein